MVQPEALGKPEVIAGRSGGEARGEGGFAMRETSAAVGQRMGREEERTLEDADLFRHVETQNEGHAAAVRSFFDGKLSLLKKSLMPLAVAAGSSLAMK